LFAIAYAVLEQNAVMLERNKRDASLVGSFIFVSDRTGEIIKQVSTWTYLVQFDNKKGGGDMPMPIELVDLTALKFKEDEPPWLVFPSRERLQQYIDWMKA
jgi:hypothetical protein